LVRLATPVGGGNQGNIKFTLCSSPVALGYHRVSDVARRSRAGHLRLVSKIVVAIRSHHLDRPPLAFWPDGTFVHI